MQYMVMYQLCLSVAQNLCFCIDGSRLATSQVTTLSQQPLFPSPPPTPPPSPNPGHPKSMPFLRASWSMLCCLRRLHAVCGACILSIVCLNHQQCLKLSSIHDSVACLLAFSCSLCRSTSSTLCNVSRTSAQWCCLVWYHSCY